jgi:predicted outer membrane repeat protein
MGMRDMGKRFELAVAFLVLNLVPNDVLGWAADTGENLLEAKAKATQIYVDISNASGNEDGTSWATAFTKVQSGIEAAFSNGGGEVWVAEGVYSETRSSSPHGDGIDTGSITMRSNVHIYGGFSGSETSREQRDWEIYVTVLDGSTARSGAPARHVVLGCNNGTLDGFTVTGGNADGDPDFSHGSGGGLYNSSTSPTIANCIFTGNQADLYGGGISNRSSSWPEFDNCTFTNNHAEFGGAISFTSSSSTLDQCTFANNQADSGGGIYNFSSSPLIVDCTFTGNQVGFGGGISNFSNSSPTLIRCDYSGNQADSSGGGLYNSSSSPTVVSCTFTNNQANSGGGLYNFFSSATLVNCTFTDNQADIFGGAIGNSSSSPSLEDCTFTNNQANSGGGLYNSSSSPELLNCAFTGNHAFDGGGVFNLSTSSSTKFTACTFTNNQANSHGGGLYNWTSTPTLTNCTFTSNQAFDGGGLYNFSSFSATKLTSCTFTNNQATFYGGAVVNNDATLTLSNCLFAKNHALRGGALSTLDGKLTLTNNTIVLNSATDSGCLYVLSSSNAAVVTNSILWDNEPNELTHVNSSPTIVTYSNVQGGYSGTGNIETAPLLLASAGYRTLPISPCVDMGTSGGAPATDILGVIRPQGPGIDIGAYETITGLLDSDGDRIPDDWETTADTDGDDTPNHVDVDSDNDTLPDSLELEILADPYDSDTDDDGMSDGWEVEHNLNPLFDDSAQDLDGDSLSNLTEFQINTDPNNQDTDGDDIPDGSEVASTLNPNDPDTDDDGMPDGWEVANSFDPLANDSDEDADTDALSNENEFTASTDPHNPDTEADGMPDGWEVANNLDPLVDDSDEDADADALSNGSEFIANTDAESPDTDADGTPDGWELANSFDPLVSDSSQDADGDGLSNLDEYQANTQAHDNDSDDDGIWDGYEEAYNLDQQINDASADPDGDLFTNLQEFGMQTDPHDPFDPPADVFVSTTGSDTTGDGTEGIPWKTIGFAMQQVSQFATDFHSVTIHLAAGDYVESVTFVPYVTLLGADPGDPLETAIRWFGGTSDNVVVRAANDTAIRDVRITFPANTISSDVVLVELDNVNMEMTNVVLDGGFKPLSTAIQAVGNGSSGSVLRDSQVLRVRDGVWATDSAITIARNTFDQILNDAVSVQHAKNGKIVVTPEIGDVSRVSTTGFNRFLAVEGLCIRNGTGELTQAEVNDWGVYTGAEVATRTSGQVDFVPYLGMPLEFGSLAINLEDGDTLQQIPSANGPQVWIDGKRIDAERDGASGIFFFNALEPGNLDVNGTAQGYLDGFWPLTVYDDRVNIASLTMFAEGSLEPADIDGNGEVNAIDVQNTINAALGLATAYDCDIDGSGTSDAIDVQLVINAALGL